MASYSGRINCPIPQSVLLEMVKEENRLRTSEEFQRKVAEEERNNESDGTNSIVELQVIYNKIKLLLINNTAHFC